MKNSKRFIALLLTFVLVFGTMSSAFAAVNEDVVDTAYEVAVAKLNAVGIMEGYPDGTFRPEGQITRAEFAKIAVLALGLNDAAEVSKANTVFTDVDATHWAAGYINVAVDRGVLKGYPDGSYKPSNPLSNAEAITVLTRLIGLGPVVDKEGNWPANYITRANMVGILEDVNVSSAATATRGNAAKMLVNTLTVNKWGAAGYNSDGTVQYGELEDKTLLTDNLGINEYLKVRVEDFDVEDGEIITSKGVFELASGDDFYELFLNEVALWVNKDKEVIFAEITSDYKIDAVKFNDDMNKVKLLTTDKEYDINSKAGIVFEGDLLTTGSALAGNEYAYAKVVFNDKNDVIFMDVYPMEDLFVAEGIDKDDENVVIAIGDEISLKDYAILKDGRLTTTAGIEKGDVVFFNRDAEVAEIYNNVKTGEIERVYSDAIVVDGKEYTFTDSVVEGISNAYYVDGDQLEAIDASVAKDMEAAEEKVNVYVDRAGELVLVVGNMEEAKTNKVAGILLETTVYDTSFSRSYAEFLFVNQEGTKVTESVRLDNLDKLNGEDVDTAKVNTETNTAKITLENGDTVDLDEAAKVGQILQFVYDEDGDIAEINTYEDNVDADANYATSESDIKVDDKYDGNGNRITSNIIVFAVKGFENLEDTISAKDVEVLKWDKDNFDKIPEGAVVYAEDEKVLYVVTSAVNDATEDVVAVVSDTREDADGKLVRVTAYSADGKNNYYVDGVDKNLTKGALVVLEVGKDSGEVTGIKAVDYDKDILVEDNDLTEVSITSKRFTADATEYRLVSNYVIINAQDTEDIKIINLRELRDLGKVTIDFVLDAEDSLYVNTIIVR